MEENALYGVRNGIRYSPGLGEPIYLEGDDPFIDEMVEWTKQQIAKNDTNAQRVSPDMHL